MPTLEVRGPLTTAQCRVLAGALGERSEFTIARHHLWRGSCTAYCVGEPEGPVAALVQPYDAVAEPTGIGSDAGALHALLQTAQGWACVEVERDVAEALADLLSARTGQPCRLYGGVYYTLTGPARVCERPDVRLLTPDDLPLLTAAPNDLQGTGFGDAKGLLRQGALAAAIIDGEIVAAAFTVAITAQYAEIGVETLEGYRGRGYATAAASLVARWLQARGLTPTWSTGEGNWASQRVAEKLGFRRCLERTYVIPRREPASHAEALAEVAAQ